MAPKFLTPVLSVAPQISTADLPAIAQAGFKSIICNRPDGESADQTGYSEIESAAKALGLEARYLPAETGKVSDEQSAAFGKLMDELPKPVLAYCRSGMRSTTMWALANAANLPLPGIIEAANRAGYDLKGLMRRIINGGKTPVEVADVSHDVVIIGGGAAGIATAASLLARSPNLDVAIIDPADIHYYQPGWTMVGAGVFDAPFTARTMASLLPHGVGWIKAAVAAIEPERNAVILDGCRVVSYQQLVVWGARLAGDRRSGRCPGPQRRNLQLPLRSSPLHLETGARPARWQGDLYSTTYAHQVCWRTAKSHVPVRRPLEAPGRAQGY